MEVTSKVTSPTRAADEVSIGYEVEGHEIRVELNMPLATAQSLKRIVDFVTLEGQPDPSDNDHANGEAFAGLVGTSFELDLPKIAEEVKQAIIGG